MRFNYYVKSRNSEKLQEKHYFSALLPLYSYLHVCITVNK